MNPSNLKTYEDEKSFISKGHSSSFNAEADEINENCKETTDNKTTKFEIQSIAPDI